MWSDIFPKLSHIFNLLDNISIIILLENTYEIQKEIKGGNYLRINLLGQFIYNVIDRIRPFLEDKKSLKFRSMNINGCMCKFCQDITFDTTIEDLGLVWLCGRLQEEGKWVSLEGFCLTSKGG